MPRIRKSRTCCCQLSGAAKLGVAPLAARPRVQPWVLQAACPEDPKLELALLLYMLTHSIAAMACDTVASWFRGDESEVQGEVGSAWQGLAPGAFYAEHPSWPQLATANCATAAVHCTVPNGTPC